MTAAERVPSPAPAKQRRPSVRETRLAGDTPETIRQRAERIAAAEIAASSDRTEDEAFERVVLPAVKSIIQASIVLRDAPMSFELVQAILANDPVATAFAKIIDNSDGAEAFLEGLP